MTIGIMHITDKNFRMTIPEDIREVEGIQQGDFIQIDIKKIDIPKNREVNPVVIKTTPELISELNTNINLLPDRITIAIVTALGDGLGTKKGQNEDELKIMAQGRAFGTTKCEMK